jgi:hypothetical protein
MQLLFSERLKNIGDIIYIYMGRRGSVMGWRGSVMGRRGSVMGRRGSVGSASACCKAGPSSILGSAPQGSFPH